MSTATATLVSTIELHHLRALRAADSIVLRHYNGQSVIEANVRAENSRDGFDHQTVIYTDDALTDYSRPSYTGPRDGRSFTAFEMFHCGAKFDDVLSAIVGRIGKGDTLRLNWRRGAGDCESTRDAGIVTDDVHLRITKPSGKGETYLLAYSAGADNSARMIRR